MVKILKKLIAAEFYVNRLIGFCDRKTDKFEMEVDCSSYVGYNLFSFLLTLFSVYFNWINLLCFFANITKEQKLSHFGINTSALK